MQYLGEVPSLDEVTCHITGCLPMDCGGNVMPGHPGHRVPVNEICPGAPDKDPSLFHAGDRGTPNPNYDIKETS